MEQTHALSVSAVAEALGTDIEHGLSDAVAKARLAEYGANELPPEKKMSPLVMFFRQFHSGLTYILLAAAAISVAAGEWSDCFGILLAVAIKAVIGFVQERKAEGALDRLRDMVVQEAAVIRDRRVHRVPARELVPGDVVLLVEGDRITADMRLAESRGLATNESALTGESANSRKSVEAVDASALLPERACMAWMGTTVISGEGRGIVVETGKRTAFGKIADSLVSIRRGRTPLEERLDKLGRQLGFSAVLLCLLVMVFGTLRGDALLQMFFFAIALMVSIVPEGLPAVLAVVLAIGVQRMAKRNAIVRHVPSVETLGITDIICTDKTGTLTENKMTVREVHVAGRRVTVSGEGWDPRGEFMIDGRSFRPGDIPDFDLLLRATALCNKAALQWKDDRAAVIGEPTEGALAVMSAKAGYERTSLEMEYRLVEEIPFNSERKFRAVLLERNDVRGVHSRVIFAVGAYGIIRDRSTHVGADGRGRTLDGAARAECDAANHDMANRSLRVLGVAFKFVGESQDSLDDRDVRDLAFLGAVGMIDPPRVGVAKAIARCHRAGVRVIMVTGDQRDTALAIGREIGLFETADRLEERVHTEKEIAQMDERTFSAALKNAVVFARVTPETKLRIVSGLQQLGHVVAMTGDGVNDAPALKKASIGVAMGITGTDVTKEVADMVLADDNFVSIVSAIEEGRIVFRNVKQTTAYLFMTNVGEIVTIFASMAFGLPLPLLPTQILWMNLITDGFPDMALATEPPSGDALSEPPRGKDAPIISKSVLILSVITCAVMCMGTILLYALAIVDHDLSYARSVAFTAMAVFQIWNVFNMRSFTASIFSLGLFTNKYVLAAVVGAFGLQMTVLYQPQLRKLFSTQPIDLKEWLLILVVTGSVIVVVEAYKSMCRKGFIPKNWQ